MKETRSNGHEELEIWPVLDVKKAILHRDRKLVSFVSPFKSTLYKNQSIRKLYVPGGTVSGLGVPLGTIGHAFLVSGPSVHVRPAFETAFLGLFDHL